jgi:DNA repair exonuclease SbcCD ATPase subunit
LFEERRQKENAISKQKKASLECSGDCRRKLRDADREKESLRREIKLLEEKNLRTERELQNVKSTLLHEQKNKESSAETARLLSLLSALQDQNAHLESSLSAETRLKLDLFSALGEARRQLQIRDSFLKSKEEELDEVRGQLVELLAVTDFSNQQHPHDLQQVQLRCVKNNVGMTECHPSSSSPQQRNDSLSFSPLIES